MNNHDFKNEYPNLYGLSLAFRFFGWLLSIASAIFLIIGFTELDSYDNSFAYIILASVFGALMLAVFWFAMAEVLKVFVRIEFNTRKDTPFKETPDHFSSIPGNKDYLSYEDWKKNNPSKSINDYYETIMKM